MPIIHHSTRYVHQHMDKTNDYRTLEEIRQRKSELRRQIDRDNEHIGRLWSSLFVKRNESTTGQFVSGLLANSAMMIDAFLLVRKLRRDYSGVINSLRKKKS